MNVVPRRIKALQATCPKCGSVAGVACIGKRGPRRASHQERHSAPKTQKLTASPKGFYVSDEWRRVRYEALRLHGAVCQCCGTKAAKGNPLHVDHIKPRSKHPELALDINNLQVLCADCNLGKSARDQTDWRGA